MKNRSVPVDTVLPHIAWRDVADGPVSGAQVYLGAIFIMLKRARAESSTPAQLGYGTQSLTLFIDDIEAHFERSKSTGARILEEGIPVRGGRWPSPALLETRPRPQPGGLGRHNRRALTGVRHNRTECPIFIPTRLTTFRRKIRFRGLRTAPSRTQRVPRLRMKSCVINSSIPSRARKQAVPMARFANFAPLSG
jgi:hypothetical protein